MYFIILASDRPGMLDRRIAIRQRHLDYWTGIPGAVKVAGAMLDADGNPKGSSFLIEAADEDAARALLAGDPFTTEGIFGEVRLETVRPAIGEWKPD